MDIVNRNGYKLTNLNKINIILGKNGCGKSRMLREIDEKFQDDVKNYGKSKYITPERGGELRYDTGVESNIENTASFLENTRRRNQTGQFRQQTISLYRKLEILVLREIEKEKRQDKSYTFDSYIGKINFLLENIEIQRKDSFFEIYEKNKPDSTLAPNNISSGEAELITLAIEIFVFQKESIMGKENILFLDEPDLHLHPDLQGRLVDLIKKIVEEGDIRLILATHSTSILGALENCEYAHIAFMKPREKEIIFKPVSQECKKVMQVFGAHPISHIYNKDPIMLVEGEDDERIWQQALRTSQGRLRIYPVSCDGFGNMDRFEREVQEIMNSIYDDATAYSLRDRDNDTEEINDIPPITRFRLSCRTAENLLLSDEILASLPIKSWEDMKIGIDKWLQDNTSHQNFGGMQQFKDGDFDRKSSDLKEIRNDLLSITGCTKPWEVAVGQVIGKLTWKENADFEKENSIFNFLGKKLVTKIIPE